MNTMKTSEFNYEQAFERNIGWLTRAEQDRLRVSRVAIAGVGGAGGFQAQALARLGVGHFRIADPDVFEMTNLNRQVGASMSTLGQPKARVIEEMIHSINPEAQVETFAEGITGRNADRFLDGADLVIDGIDYFEVEAKCLLFEKSLEKKIPALTSCPLGFGASLIVFMPGGMKYSQYFDFREGMPAQEKLMALTYGLSPSPLCLRYMDKSALNVGGRRGASVSPGLMTVGALTGSEAVKILTGKMPVRACPAVYQVDLLTQRVAKKYYPMGMGSPWQRLKKSVLLKLIQKERKQE